MPVMAPDKKQREQVSDQPGQFWSMYGWHSPTLGQCRGKTVDTCSHTCPCLLALTQALRVPDTHKATRGGLFSETPDACCPFPQPRLCSGTWGRCTQLQPGEGAAGGSFPALCADMVGASLPVHPHQLLRSLGAQGQGACGHLLGAGRFPFLAEFASLPGGSLWSSLVPAEAMAAQGQKGQGTCPRSQPSEGKSQQFIPSPLTWASL